MNLMFESPVIIQCIVFLAVAGSLLALAFLAAGRDRLIDARVRGLVSQSDRHGPQGRGAIASLNLKLPQVAQTLLPKNEKQRSLLQARLVEAGIYDPWAPSIYTAVRIVLTLALPAICIGGAFVGRLPLSYAFLAGGPATVIGFCLPHLWLHRRRAKRHSILRRALPDFLDLVVACLGGGLSVQAALKQVAEELKIAHPLLSAELQVALRDIELGRTLDHALEQLAARTGMEELRTLCSFVHQTTKFGTTITDALTQLGEMLRIQREQTAEEMAQKAAVKILFPTLLFIFPTVFVVLAGPAAIQIKEGLNLSTPSASSPARRK